MVRTPPPSQYMSEKPFSRAFQIYPTYPPLGHSAGTNEATITVIPENAPCWHIPYRTPEIGADSEYVLLRAKEAARRWKARGWVGSSGPVSNVPLWEELLSFVDNSFQDILWIKVPSHVNVEGNEQANTLANEGRLNNPLNPPPRHVLNCSGRPPVQGQAPNAQRLTHRNFCLFDPYPSVLCWRTFQSPQRWQ